MKVIRQGAKMAGRAGTQNQKDQNLSNGNDYMVGKSYKLNGSSPDQSSIRLKIPSSETSRRIPNAIRGRVTFATS
jgi:hypothetical protein